MHLRAGIALTNGDLAALGLSEGQATEVLKRLGEGVKANEQAMIQADNQVRAAKAALANLERRLRTGQVEADDEDQLRTLRQAVTTAEQDRQAINEQVGRYATARLNGTLVSRWEDACAFCDLPLELRHLEGLDANRIGEISDNLASEARALEDALPAFDAQTLAGVRAAINTHLPGVRRAEVVALPLPPELAEPDDSFGSGELGPE
jgi:hypothetical protein